MTSLIPSNSQQESDLLEDLLASWFAAQEEGRPLRLEDHLADHPSMLASFQAMVSTDATLLDTLPQLDARPAPLLGPGIEVGDCILEMLLGEGAMGQVWQANQHSIPRKVALKILHPMLSAGSSESVRLRREAAILGTLDHPSIVPIHATGEFGGRIYLAMKLLEGKTLGALATTLDARTVARIGASVARALGAAHAAGVVHRDVKPANILVEGTHPWLLDFGLARGAHDAKMTGTGLIPGTLPYVAPEQLQGSSNPLDHRSDIYSLGATLWHTLRGTPPFEADNNEALVRRILVDDPPRLECDRRDQDLEAILHRALDKRPELRFPSARALAEELDRFAAGEPIETRAPGLIRRTWRRWARRPKTTAASAILIVVLLGSAALILRGMQRETRGIALGRARVEAALARHDPWMAEAELLRLEQAYGSRFEDATLSSTARAQRALEDVLTRLQARLATQAPERLSETLRQLPPEVADSPRALAVKLVLKAGLRTLDRDDADLALLVERGELPALCAMTAALLDDRALPEPPQPSQADDLFFAALLLRAAEADATVSRRYLEAAITLDSDEARALFSLGVLGLETSNYDSARASFLAVGQHPSLAASATAHLARLHLYEQRVEDARALLERAREWARDDLPDEIVLGELETALRTESPASARTKIDAALASNPDAAIFWHLSGLLAASQGEGEKAREHLGRVLTKSGFAVHRRRARTALLQLDLSETPETAKIKPVTGLSAERRALLRRLLDEALALTEEARRVNDPRGLAQALHAASRCAHALGKHMDSWRLLMEGLELEIDDPQVIMRFGLVIADRAIARLGGQEVDPDQRAASGPFEHWVGLARSRLRKMLATQGRGALVASETTICTALWCDAILTLELDGRTEARKLMKTWLDRYGEQLPAEDYKVIYLTAIEMQIR